MHKHGAVNSIRDIGAWKSNAASTAELMPFYEFVLDCCSGVTSRLCTLDKPYGRPGVGVQKSYPKQPPAVAAAVLCLHWFLLLKQDSPVSMHPTAILWGCSSCWGTDCTGLGDNSGAPPTSSRMPFSPIPSFTTGLLLALLFQVAL